MSDHLLLVTYLSPEFQRALSAAKERAGLTESEVPVVHVRATEGADTLAIVEATFGEVGSGRSPRWELHERAGQTLPGNLLRRRDSPFEATP